MGKDILRVNIITPDSSKVFDIKDLTIFDEISNTEDSIIANGELYDALKCFDNMITPFHSISTSIDVNVGVVTVECITKSIDTTPEITMKHFVEVLKDVIPNKLKISYESVECNQYKLLGCSKFLLTIKK